MFLSGRSVVCLTTLPNSTSYLYIHLNTVGLIGFCKPLKSESNTKFSKPSENRVSHCQKTFDIVRLGLMAQRGSGLESIDVAYPLFWHAEFQNPFSLIFSSLPFDVLVVTTVNPQLCLGSKLVDWHWGAMFDPCDHLLIDLSPRTDDQLLKTADPFLRISISPQRFLQLESSDDNHTKSLYLFNRYNRFSASAKDNSFSLVRESLYSFCASAEWICSKETCKARKASLDKFSKLIWFLFIKRKIRKWKRNVIATEKWLQPPKVLNPHGFSHLSWFGVFFCPFFCVEQQVGYPDSYKAGTYIVSSWTNFYIPNWIA